MKLLLEIEGIKKKVEDLLKKRTLEADTILFENTDSFGLNQKWLEFKNTERIRYGSNPRPTCLQRKR
jgi:hypothetical protein